MRTYRNRSIAPITAFLTLAAIAGPVHAQGASSGLHLGGIAPAMGVATQATYSLGDVIGKALASSSALKIANHMLDLDAAKVSLAKDSGGPRVSASATGMHYDQATLVKFGGTNILVQPQDMAVFGLDASLPIDLTGQIKAQTDVNRLQALSDRFTRDAVVNNLILTAETTYFSVLRALHQVAVAQASLTDAQTQQSLTSRQYQAGTGQRIDLLRANTQVASAQQNLLQAKNALSISRVNLNDLVGRPLNAPTDVQDVAGVTAGVTARSASTPGQDQVNSSPSYFATPISDVESIDIDKSIQSAVDSRPELRSDLVDIQAATKSIKLSRAGLEPSLTISALGTYYNKTSSNS